jgi:hypothetical protein
VRELHQSVAEGALAVINMGDDAQVARALARNRFKNISGDVSKVSTGRAAAETTLKHCRRIKSYCIETGKSSHCTSTKHENSSNLDGTNTTRK